MENASKTKHGLSLGIKLHLAGLLVLIAAGGYVYVKYGTIATVNGKPISRIAYYRELEKQSGKTTLENMVTDVLVRDTAKNKGISVPAEAIAGQMTQIEMQMKSQGQTLDDTLKKQGVTRKDLEYQVELQLLASKMGQGEASATATQVEAFLAQNKALLPADKKPDELRQLAKQEIEKQIKAANVQKWLADLRSVANLVFR